MPEYVTREEFESRVGYLEQEIEGEKLVTRYILEQTRRNGDDLAALKTRMDRVEKGLESLNSSFQSFVRNFPSTVRDVMRDVLQERERKA